MEIAFLKKYLYILIELQVLYWSILSNRILAEYGCLSAVLFDQG
jgi:hypothetical protein